MSVITSDCLIGYPLRFVCVIIFVGLVVVNSRQVWCNYTYNVDIGLRNEDLCTQILRNLALKCKM